MSVEVLLEELEVLESIYPTELQRVSERDVRIEAEPDDLADGVEAVKVTLCVSYPDGYPDVLPNLSLQVEETNFNENEVQGLINDLRAVGEENLGMAMTFTLVSHLREQLSKLVQSKADELERAEEARTRGTPVTPESFKVWKTNFDKELALKKAQEDDDKLRGLTPKEREEWKKLGTRLTGRQLFERNKGIEDETLLEEGTVSVDISQYERTREEMEPEEAVTFSDSD
ncbi:RWD domain-containing protein [Laccaria bicolor S238N-H82]|uniref:RWD domain-containing protein n=1 Tax=Laccaria bicolor (strain S238N-H82 / ATCC MYA-4686) TaxID=486041 RepID=B0CSD3_LACBS|nr:RWD domain-containing protein [Laccaria bicolor S238N-H82]EDR14286.1 RWD domain-containing protein [Laccaria bicolor S238N-H82]|eukprot:XP_001874845.1 RWD domain-containing protein [Laccaria bicolor S238N-H82]